MQKIWDTTIVAIVSQKGGGGKTTVATNLAVASARAKAPTLLLDLDPQQSAFRWSRWRREAGKAETLIEGDTACSVSLANKVKQAEANGVKLCVIDTPPSKGPEADAAASAAHLILVVIQPAILDLMTLAETHSLGSVAGGESFVVFNRAPVSGSILIDARRQAEQAGYRVSPSALSDRASFRAAPLEGLAVLDIDTGKAAAEVAALYTWMIAELKKGRAPQAARVRKSTWGALQ